MIYNKSIETYLFNLSNDLIRKPKAAKEEDFETTKSPEDKSFIYDNQIDAAKEIVKSFTAHIEGQSEHKSRNHHVILVAKMQSGKTGVCNAVVNIIESSNGYIETYLKKDPKINFKYFFITGMNDKGLHNQTTERVMDQIINANYENICNGPLEKNSNPKYFIQKNSNLRKSNINLSNCLIFIDESHFGSGKSNVLTKFLEENGIDWKNDSCLRDKNIYIVSVSATPFDEIVSDISDCKTIVELKTPESEKMKYIGVSEYIKSGCVINANKEDFKREIVDIIMDIYNNKIKKNEEKGIIFIRTRDDQITKLPIIKNKFEVIKLNSKDGSINYNSVKRAIGLHIRGGDVDGECKKPIIFLVKGAYRAGISILNEHKDYIYLIYDDSTKADTTAQGLLGRMCGYRKKGELNTIFYVNKQHAEDYAEWEQDFKVKDKIPSSITWNEVPDEELHLYKNGTGDAKLSTKCNGNIELKIKDTEIEGFVKASLRKDIANKDYARSKIKELIPHIDFDYMGECYISGKNTYNSQSVIQKWFDNFETDSYCPSFRPDKYFKEDTNRDELSFEDIGKTICHIVLDASYTLDDENNIKTISGNKRLLIYHGMIKLKSIKKNHNILIKEHKNTEIKCQ